MIKGANDRAYGWLAAFLTMTGVAVSILAGLGTRLLFENIEIVLGAIGTLFLGGFAYLLYRQLKTVERGIENNLRMLQYDSQEVAHRLLATIKESNPIASSPPGFSHLQEHVEKFVQLYPYDKNVALLCSFSNNYSESYYGAIKEVLAESGYRLFRVSDQQVSDDVFSNLLVTLLGCKYGIAIFQQHESGEESNSSIAFELGIMLTMGRRVMILKHSRIMRLPTDMTGYRYHEYTRLDEIPELVRLWCQNDLRTEHSRRRRRSE